MKIHHVKAKVLALVLFGVLSAGIFLYLFTAAGGQLRLHAPYRVTVVVPEAFQLVPNSDVRMGGVKVGRIDDIDNRGALSQLEVELNAAQAPLPRDSRVAVRTKTLVGENYLEIVPGAGKGGTIPDGGTVALAQAEEAVPIDKVLSTFDRRTRERVTANLRSLGRAVDGRGTDLNAALASLRPAAQDGAAVTAVLAAQRERVASLVDDAGRVMTAVGARSRQLQGLVRDARTTAAAVAARDDRLAATIRQLPGTLTQAQTSLRTLSAFSASATPVVASLRRGADALAPAARDLAPAARETRRVTDALVPTLQRLDRTLPALRRFAEVVPDASAATAALLRQVNPFVEYLQPYTRDATAFFANMGAPFNTDAMGYVGHVKALANASSAKVFTAAEQKALDALVYSGIVGLVNNQKVNPYPKPGTSGSPQAFDGSYPQVRARP